MRYKKKISFLFFGLGSIGQRHLINLKKILGNKADFFAYRKIGKKKIIHQKYGNSSKNIEEKYNIKSVKNLKSINSINPDIIFITNPSSLHIRTFLKLKNLKNKYCFIEKPLDSSLKFIKKFENLIKKNNFNTFIGYNLRFHDCVQKILSILKKNNLGKINYASFYYGDSIENWHKYEDYKKSYAAQKKLGGGIVLTSIHELDLMLYLFGNAKYINSHYSKISELKLNVEDFAVSTFENSFNKKKFISTVILNCFQVNPQRYIKIILQKGTIFVDLIKYQIKISTKSTTKKVYFKNDHNLMYLRQLRYFLSLYNKNINVCQKFNHTNAIKTLKIALDIKSKIKK